MPSFWRNAEGAILPVVTRRFAVGDAIPALLKGAVQDTLRAAAGGPLERGRVSAAQVSVLANPLIGLVPAARAKAVREGHGKLDRAQDFVSIAGCSRRPKR